MIIPWHFLLHLARWAIRLVMFAVILRRRHRPAVTLVWLGLTYFVPEAAVVMYVLLGDRRLGRRRARLHRQVTGAIRAEAQHARPRRSPSQPQVEPWLTPLVRQIERSTGMPVVSGNSVELLTDSAAMIRRLVSLIDEAKSNAHLLYYLFEPDKTGRAVADALIRARQRGVICRLLADAAGSRRFFRSGLYTELLQHNVQIEAMLPVAPLRRGLARIDLRNHRKLAVMDGSVAIVGSQNIIDDDYGNPNGGCWADMSACVRGPIVEQLQTTFVEDWAFDADEVLDDQEIFPKLAEAGEVAAQAVATGPSHKTETLPRVLLTAINAAQKRIIISSPYLVPDEPTILALAMAADRGVEVSIVVPKHSDHMIVAAAGRSYYRDLLESGVRLYRYNACPLHSKTVTVDESFALVGSANLDVRSFYLCFELNVLLYGQRVTRQVCDAQLQYITDATPIDLADWLKRPFYKSYFENLASLGSPLL